MSLAKTICIDGRPIGEGHPPYVIAELSGNHGGKLENALALVDAAAGCGVDAIKIQTYRPDTITLNHDGPGFQIEGGLWHGRKLYELYDEAHTPWEWHEALFARAREHDVTLFSSPFDHTAVDFLDELNAPAFKIASFELVDIPLIKKAASTGKPLIMSTGMASFADISEAVAAATAAGATEVALLHCISGYPTPISECNLRTIRDLMEHFNVPIGLSDHTIDHSASVTAVALGATIIEKHFKLSEDDNSVDAAFSLSPERFRDLVAQARRSWEALGVVGYGLRDSEESGHSFRRSLYVAKPVAKGEAFSAENIRSVRPGFGLHPRHFEEVIGRVASEDLPFGTPLKWEHVS